MAIPFFMFSIANIQLLIPYTSVQKVNSGFFQYPKQEISDSPQLWLPYIEEAWKGELVRFFRKTGIGLMPIKDGIVYNLVNLVGDPIIALATGATMAVHGLGAKMDQKKILV